MGKRGVALVVGIACGLGAPASARADVDWLESYREILRDGFTYVGVSVQPTGVPLPAQDPVRYGQVQIPPYGPGADTGASPDAGGPAYGESLFSQIAHALKSGSGAP